MSDDKPEADPEADKPQPGLRSRLRAHDGDLGLTQERLDESRAEMDVRMVEDQDEDEPAKPMINSFPIPITAHHAAAHKVVNDKMRQSGIDDAFFNLPPELAEKFAAGFGPQVAHDLDAQVVEALSRPQRIELPKDVDYSAVLLRAQEDEARAEEREEKALQIAARNLNVAIASGIVTVLSLMATVVIFVLSR